MSAKKISVLLIFLIVSYGAYSYYKTLSRRVELKEGDVVEIIRNELKENPDIVVDAFKAHLDNQQKKQEEKIITTIEESKKDLVDNKEDPKYGKADAKNTIVTFYDYNCSYCKNMSSVINKVIVDRNDIFIIFKELPILGKASVEASKAALAVNIISPDKFLVFHTKLMDAEKSGKNIEDVIKNSAEDLQIDTVNLFKKMNTDEIQNILENNRSLAMNLGIKGTPALVINGRLYPGAMNVDQITNILDEDNNSSADTK